MLGYTLAILAMFCFGMIGIFQKVADRKHCTPIVLATVMYISSGILMTLQVTLIRGASLVPPKPIIWTALLFGISAVSAIWVFQHGIHYGKIATSWTILNLSAAIPAVLSTMIYKERMSPIKLIILMAIVLAILLLYKDMKDETSHG